MGRGPDVREVCGLDLGVVWSRLRLVAPDPARAMVTTAGGDPALPQTAAGWAVAHLVLGAWWPALAIGAALCWHASAQARHALGAYLDAVETLADPYGRDLARAVGVASDGSRLTPDEGAQVNRVIGKGA